MSNKRGYQLFLRKIKKVSSFGGTMPCQVYTLNNKN